MSSHSFPCTCLNQKLFPLLFLYIPFQIVLVYIICRYLEKDTSNRRINSIQTWKFISRWNQHLEQNWAGSFIEGPDEKLRKFCWAKKKSYFAIVEMSIFKYLQKWQKWITAWIIQFICSTPQIDVTDAAACSSLWLFRCSRMPMIRITN